ncbi:MAG: hypothetical protein Q8K49_07770 [Brevundimonas sp.]|nr:hypothetical protein [Brevundimonas sp.]
MIRIGHSCATYAQEPIRLTGFKALLPQDGSSALVDEPEGPAQQD